MHASLFCDEARSFFGLNLPRLHALTWAMDLLDPMLISKHEAAITISVVGCMEQQKQVYPSGHQHVRSMELVQELTRAMDIPAKVSASARVRWKPAGDGMVKMNPTGL